MKMTSSVSKKKVGKAPAPKMSSTPPMAKKGMSVSKMKKSC